MIYYVYEMIFTRKEVNNDVEEKEKDSGTTARVR